MLLGIVLMLAVAGTETGAGEAIVLSPAPNCPLPRPTAPPCMKVICSVDTGGWDFLPDSTKNGTACDDSNACTYGETCSNGSCRGTSVNCTSTDPCVAKTCNGTPSCSVSIRTGLSGNDGNPCTYGETCNASAQCVGGSIVTCVSTTCLTRSCNGTATCTETPAASSVSCNDGQPCTFADHCSGTGTCTGTAITCAPRGPCETSACNGTATCTYSARAPGTACPNATNPCELVCDGSSYFCQPE